jgi:hypothetical protein
MYSSLDNYISAHSLDGEWADHLMVQATADAFGLAIKIYSRGRKEIVTPRNSAILDSVSIVYNDCNHYDALIEDVSLMEYEESSVKPHSNVKVQGVVLPGGVSSASTVAEAFTLLDPTVIGQVDNSSSYMDSVNLALRLLHQRYNDVENKQFNNECIQQINLFYGLDLDASDFIGAMTHLLENNLDGAIAWLLFGKCPIPKGRYDAHGTTMSDGVESASESAKQSPSLIVLAPIIQAFDKLGLLHGEANSKDVCTLQANGRNCKDPSVDQGIKPAHVINFVSAAFKAASGGLHFCGMGGKRAMKNVTDKLCSRLFESCYNANHFSLGACMTGGILGDTVAHTREMSLDYKTLFEGPGVLVIVHEALVKDPNVTFIQNVDVTEEEIATLRAAVFKRRSEKSKKLHEKKVKNKHAGVEVSAHGLAMGTALHEKKVKNKHGVEA